MSVRTLAAAPDRLGRTASAAARLADAGKGSVHQ